MKGSWILVRCCRAGGNLSIVGGGFKARTPSGATVSFPRCVSFSTHPLPSRDVDHNDHNHSRHPRGRGGTASPAQSAATASARTVRPPPGLVVFPPYNEDRDQDQSSSSQQRTVLSRAYFERKATKPPPTAPTTTTVEMPTSSSSSSSTTTSTNGDDTVIADIEELHQRAVLRGERTYIDPATGFTVFTELVHLQRGKCCGNACRHCPYGWENVRNGNISSASRPPPAAKVRSGHPDAINALLSMIQDKQQQYQHSQQQQQQQQQEMMEAADNTTGTTTNGTGQAAKDATNKKTGGRHGGRLTEKNVPYTRGGDKGTSQLLTGERRSKADLTFEAMGTVDELCSYVGVIYSHLEQQQQQQNQTTDNNNNNNNNNDTTSAATTKDEMLITRDELQEYLLDIMSRLFDIGSHIAKPRKVKTNKDKDGSDSDSDLDEMEFRPDGVGGGFDKQHIDELEDWIDRFTNELPELDSFILPSGSIAASHFHVARTVCRRAERRVVPLVHPPSSSPGDGERDEDGDAAPGAKGNGGGVCDPNALKYLNRLSDFFFSAARWANYHGDHPEILYKRPERGAKQRDRIISQPKQAR